MLPQRRGSPQKFFSPRVPHIFFTAKRVLQGGKGWETLVKWLRQMAYDQEVMGSKPCTIYWMDISDAITYKKIMKIKVVEWGTPKKNILTK